MKIKIIGVGNLKEKYLKEASTEYTKRISRFANVEIIEIGEEKLSDRPSDKNIEDALKKEEERIIEKINPSSYVIELSLDGKEITSEAFAKKIGDITLEGYSEITFIIGSSHGLGEGIRKISNFRLKISPMTFPHQLARIILLEQVYRAFKIINNEPYHK